MIFKEYLGNKIARTGMTAMLAGTILLGLSACGGTTDATPTSGTTGAATTATQATGTTGATDTTGSAAPTMSPDMSAAMSPTSGAAGAMASTPAAGGTMAVVTPAAGGSTGAGNATVVQGTLKEWAIDLSQKEVPAGKVRFMITNAGQMRHNFTVTSKGSKVGGTSTFSSSDGAQTLELDLQPGTYTAICSLPGHASRGQTVDFTVK
ncbi:MAG: hypothetical protein M3014_07445 [Chloroflexota bacterium]|nr:hypothetical protein [Chloroflexota bacterium]